MCAFVRTRAKSRAVAALHYADDNAKMSSSFQTTRRVEFRDTDAAGIAHFSVFFTYMEEAEHELWRHLGLSVKQPDGDAVISWPRVSAQCDYRSPAHFEDEITIEVRIARIGSRSVTFAFAMSCGEREIATGQLTAACCRFTHQQPPQAVEIPAEIRRKLESR